VSSARAKVPPLSVRSERAVPERRRARRPIGARLPRPGRTLVAQAAVALAAVAALAVGVVGLRVDRGGHSEAAAVGEVIGFPGGEMRVDAVRQWDEGQHAKGMPGMPIPDPLPEGYRRFWTDVTLHATAAPGLRYEPEAFTVSAEGLAPVTPHVASEGLGVIVPGAQATVTFLFQIPKEQGAIELRLRGVPRPVLLPAADGVASEKHDADH